MVDRYEAYGDRGDAIMRKEYDGSWADYDDYQAQAARIKQLEADMAIMTDTIGSLLRRVDEAYSPEDGGISMHAGGQSPDWFVEAAYQVCFGRPTDHARATSP